MPDPILRSVTELIGKTPMILLDRLSPSGGARILAKAEFLNPGGSVKDRVALAMIEDAEDSGRLEAGTAIVEATSGNTGIALAMVCAERGYRLILTMPDTMSYERRSLMERYGAEIVLTPGKDDMGGAVKKARQIVDRNHRCIQLEQFRNPANPAIHERTTGPEILADTGGQVSAFVAGVGTGGTITGVGRVLRAALPQVRLIAVEPAGSPVLGGGRAGTHAIEGIGAGFVPDVLQRDLIDEVLSVEDQAAFDMVGSLAREESLVVGISAGAAVCAAQEMASRLTPEETVVTVLPDTGARYFSVEALFNPRGRDPASNLL